MALPPYDDVQDFRADIANGVAASAFQSLAIAAWTYCESSVSTLAKQEYVDSYIDSADLARKTREHFVERVQIPEASPGRSVHFMYGDFAAPQGLQHGRMAELRVEADGEVFDLTQGMGYVDDYTYADEGQRVCIMRPTGTQIRA